MTTPPCIHQAVLLLVGTLVIAPYARSQSDSISVTPFENVWALEFGIGSDFTIQGFLGGNVSGARYFTNGHKIRLGIGVGAGSTDSDNRRVERRVDTLYNMSSGTTSDDGVNIKLYAQYLAYTPTIKGTSLYAGVGPVAAWSSSHRIEKTESDPPYYDYFVASEEIRSDTYAFGVHGVVGAEWFFSERMSLHAEYGTQVVYEWNKQTQKTLDPEYYYGSNRTYDAQSSSTAWRVLTPSVLFGITICY